MERNELTSLNPVQITESWAKINDQCHLKPLNLGDSFLFSKSNRNNIIFTNFQKRNFPSAHFTFSVPTSTPGRKVDIAGTVAASPQTGASPGYLEEMIIWQHPL